MIYSIYKDLHDGDFVTALGYEILIHTRTVGSLKVTSGKLVACDPIVHPTTEPFDIDLLTAHAPQVCIDCRRVMTADACDRNQAQRQTTEGWSIGQIWILEWLRRKQTPNLVGGQAAARAA